MLIKKIITLTSLFLMTCQALAEEQSLTGKLKIFEGYLGTWEASFDVAKGKPPVVDVATWERALNGKALRTLHSINNGEYGGESLIFFDNTKGQIVFYYFTTAEFYTTGTIEITSENAFVAYEDVSGNEDGITKVKSTSTLINKGIKVSTAYLKNGEWTKPEERLYKRSSKQVVFK
tara:strand:- start:328 stop:855 length:528 start_codon:yes stop_codon:yes gene_type:complete